MRATLTLLNTLRNVAALQTSSLRDIARAAGVSAVSVSRALRNQAGISEVTRRRILEIAQRQEYKPNPFVSTLMAEVPGGHRLHRSITAGIPGGVRLPKIFRGRETAVESARLQSRTVQL
jgi:hypothetical protein